MSGQRLNNKKTELMWIGANAGKELDFCPEKGFKWVKDRVQALGVWLSTNPANTVEANYSERLTKVRNNLSCWELRRLSLIGKITFIAITEPNCIATCLHFVTSANKP